MITKKTHAVLRDFYRRRTGFCSSRTLDRRWSSICSTDTIVLQSKSDGAELLFDTVQGDPREGRSRPPGLYDEARALVARLAVGPDRTKEDIAAHGDALEPLKLRAFAASHATAMIGLTASQASLTLPSASRPRRS